MKRAVCILGLLLMLCGVGYSQFFIGIKFMGLTFHPGKNVNGPLFKHTIGKQKRFAMNFGVAITAEYMIYGYASVKLDQAYFRDCGGKFAGMTMLNLRYTFDLRKFGDVSAGLGPFFYYRKNWNAINGYQDEGYFKISKNNKWQTKFVWYGGELEHNLPLNDRMDLSTSIFPGIPVVYALTPGVRYRITE